MWEPVSAYKAKSQTSTDTPPPSTAPSPAPNPPAAASEPSSTPAPPPSPATAVRRCCSAYQNAFTMSKDSEKAKDAFKNALPYLTTRASILDFMACVTHGMVLRVFWHDEGPKLISAARATLAALPRDPAGRRANFEKVPVLEN